MPNLPIPLPNFEPSAWRRLSLTEKALMVAAYLCDNVRLKELPGNRGEWVDEFLRSARTDVGQPWCAAFVTYCLIRSGHDPYGQDYKQGVRYPASVASWLAWASGTGRLRNSPKRGMLFVPKGVSHIGLITGVDGDEVLTLEGNTNDEGSREGYEVCRRRRKRAACRYIDLSGLRG